MFNTDCFFLSSLCHSCIVLFLRETVKARKYLYSLKRLRHQIDLLNLLCVIAVSDGWVLGLGVGRPHPHAWEVTAWPTVCGGGISTCLGTGIQRWAAILKNVSFKAIQIHNFWEKNRIKRYNFVGQNFCHRWSDRKNQTKIILHRWSDKIGPNLWLWWSDKNF